MRTANPALVQGGVEMRTMLALERSYRLGVFARLLVVVPANRRPRRRCEHGERADSRRDDEDARRAVSPPHASIRRCHACFARRDARGFGAPRTNTFSWLKN